MTRREISKVRLPAGWPRHVRSAVVHTMSLAAAALAATRGWAAKHASSRVRLRSENERLGQELALAQEELRIKDDRMSRVPGQERPHYAPVDRLAILRLRGLRGWSVQQTADRFQLSPVTVSSWMRRLDDRGPEALVQAAVPLNKYPDFVALVVQDFKLLCPSFGYQRIADFLSRAGLRLGTSTISRMLRRVVAPMPACETDDKKARGRVTRIKAERPHHVWHSDFTTIPTSTGIWTSTRPFWLPQCWPFCWWLAVLADQFSASILAIAIFATPPTPDDVRDLIGRTVDEVGAAPEHVITDMGQQFRDRGFRPWCKGIGARHVFGRLGQHGSIPFVERVIRTIKSEATSPIRIPFGRAALRKELELYRAWYNRARPHQRLCGATPHEVLEGIEPVGTRIRFEPRPGWTTDARGDSSLPRVKPRRVGALSLEMRYIEGRKHLPIIRLKEVA